MEKPPVVKMGERVLVYACAGIVDITQFILGLFVVSEVINHVIDIIFGAGLLGYAYQRKLLDTNKSLTILAVFIGEQIPFINALPFWTYDVYNLYRGVSKEVVPQNLSTPGVTLPRNQRMPVNNTKGLRPPRMKLSIKN